MKICLAPQHAPLTLAGTQVAGTITCLVPCVARPKALHEGRVRQRGVNSVVASGLHFQAAFGVICSG